MPPKSRSKIPAAAAPIDLEALQATHALGSEEMEVLRDLTSPQPNRFLEAADLLYDVEIPLPVLFELLKDPSLLSRPPILRAIAQRSHYREDGLHNFDRARLEAAGKHSPADVQKEIESSLRFHDAAVAGVPIYQTLLKDSDESVVAHAAYALAQFPECAESTVPLLVKRLKTGGSEETLATIALALGMMAPGTADDSLVSALEKLLGDASRPKLRCCAALALQRMQKEAISKKAVNVLLAYHTPEPPADWLLWNRGELIGLVIRAWAQLPPEYTDAILQAAAEPFLKYSAEDATLLGVALLKRYFPKPVPSKTLFSTFDEPRKILLLILAQHEHGWDDPLRDMLAHLGLPKKPTSLEWYIQGLDPDTGYRL